MTDMQTDTPQPESANAPPPLDAAETTGADAIEDALRDTTDAIESAAAVPGDEQVLTEVRCGQCGTKAKWSGPLTAEMLEETFTRGVDPTTELPLCVYCGTSMELVPFLTAETPANPVQQAADELARQDAERAGDAARPMYQPAIPGIHPPFDFRRAQLTAESLERHIADAEEAWESAKEEASARKKDYDAAVDTLRKHVQHSHAARVDADYQAAKVADTPERSTKCAYEVATGKPCAICRAAQANLTGVKTESVEHVAAAATVAALEDTLDVDSLSAAITSVTGVEVQGASLNALTRDDRKAVALWLEQCASSDKATELPRPTVLGRSHEAGAHDAEVQCCRLCGAKLQCFKPGFEKWAEGQLVGFDCSGELATDEARPPARRHAKRSDATKAKQAAEKTAKRAPKAKKGGRS